MPLQHKSFYTSANVFISNVGHESVEARLAKIINIDAPLKGATMMTRSARVDRIGVE